MGIRSTRKLVRRVQATSYGHALRTIPHIASNVYAGKAYGPHRKKIASEIRKIRSITKSRYNLKGIKSADTHYSR